MAEISVDESNNASVCVELVTEREYLQRNLMLQTQRKGLSASTYVYPKLDSYTLL